MTLDKLDPWGPISATLYATTDDWVTEIINGSGLPIAWPQLKERQDYSSKTRIRAYLPVISAAYFGLGELHRGVVVRHVAKALWSKLGNSSGAIAGLDTNLRAIGWTVDHETGELSTQDALLSERFFPPNTPHDAYLFIRDILRQATTALTIVDAYMSHTFFATLAALDSARALTVHFLTVGQNLSPDFNVEGANFIKQFKTRVEVRITREFHDRFIVVDDAAFYHVGASLKDAGRKAFLISRLQDEPVIQLLKSYIATSWASGQPRPFV